MSVYVDNRLALDRTRLCQLAKVERGKHIRWTAKAQLLREKAHYGELDVVRAAMLGELMRVLKPSLAQTVWRQIESEVDFGAGRLEVMVCLESRQAKLIRTAEDLDRTLPRGETVVAVDLATPATQARERLREFLSITRQEEPPVHALAKRAASRARAKRREERS